MIKSASTLFTGTLIGQLLPLAATPILTRYARPEEFGVFALMLTLVAFAGYGSAGRYEAAIAVPESDDTAAMLVKLAALICLTTAGLALLGIAIACWVVTDRSMFGLVWLALPPLIVCYSMIQAWEGWANRRSDYGAIARARIVRGVAVAACQVLLLVAGVPPLAGLVLGQVLGMGSSLAVGMVSQSDLRARLREPWPRRQILQVARDYSSYPKYNMWHGLVHAAQAPLTLAIIGSHASQAAVGAFGLVQRLMQAPSGLVGSAIAPVLLRRLVTSGVANDRRRVVIKTLMALTAFALPAFGVFIAWGALLFVHVFGAEWRLSGDIARVYAPYLMLSFIAAPLTVVSQAARKLHAAMYASMIGNAIFIGVLLLALQCGADIVAALLWVSVAISIYYVAYLTWVVHIARFEDVNA